MVKLELEESVFFVVAANCRKNEKNFVFPANRRFLRLSLFLFYVFVFDLTPSICWGYSQHSSNKGRDPTLVALTTLSAEWIFNGSIPIGYTL